MLQLQRLKSNKLPNMNTSAVPCLSRNLIVRFVVILTVAMATAPVLGLMDLQACPFDGDWQHCECERITLETVKMFCKQRNWIPSIPAVPNATSTGLRMVSVTIVQSNLILLKGETFLGQPDIQMIDLSYNQLNYINLQAFRGLENRLYQLTLNNNLLTLVPSISITNLHGLQYLYLQNNRIGSIDATLFKGTQLRNLQFLHLDHNLISSLPNGSFNGLSLQALTIGNNRLASIAVDALPTSLWLLKLNNNALNGIPFEALAHLRNLQQLDLSCNNISTLTPAASPGLKFAKELQLDLSSNRIIVVPPAAFANFERLKSLDLSYNEIDTISRIAFTGVVHLEELKLSFNRITHLETELFANLTTSLKKLDLEENRLPSVPVAIHRLQNLEYLSLKSNKISLLEPATFANARASLKELFLSYNHLDRVPTETLEGMDKLINLDLSRNRIKALQKLAFGKFNKAGNNLVRLNLAGNLISRIDEIEAFIYMSGVAYLDLSYNAIDLIKPNAFQLLSGLESLFLQANQLTQIPALALQGLRKLRNVRLDQNQIQTIPPGAMANLAQLQSLSLAHNLIHAVLTGSFPDSMTHLRSVSLANNRIIYIAQNAFYNLSSLRSIFLQNNQLTHVYSYAFNSLPQLERLHLDRNFINETSPYMLTGLPSLKVLSLSHNRLKHLESGAIIDTPALEDLDLSHNEFAVFRVDTLQRVKALKRINLAFNSLTDVDLKLFRNHLEHLNLKGNRFAKIGARSFAEFQQLKLVDLSENQIANISPYSFSNSPNLQEAIVSNNKLQSVGKSTFAKQQNWRLVDLSRNQIQIIEEGSFGQNNVQTLDLSHNRLVAIPHLGLRSIQESLKSLKLAHNIIDEVDSDFLRGMKSLEELDLSHNHLEKLAAACFQGLPYLHRLDLSGNPIKNLHTSTFKNISYYLETLSLADMNLLSVPELGQIGLMSLNLSMNRIIDITSDDFKTVKKIETLDLSNNQIRRLPPDAFSSLLNLKHLNLSHNPIWSITAETFRHLHKLETLSLHNLGLTDLDENAFQHLRNLKELRFYDHQKISDGFSLHAVNLSHLLRYLPPLRTLHLGMLNDTILDSQLHHLDPRLLKDLHIQGPRLHTINIAAFEMLRGFEVQLSITNTAITKLPAAIFETFRHVNYLSLDLSGNRLRSINPFRYAKMPAISTQGTILLDINLNGNPLECNCELAWIRDWFEYLRKTLNPDDFERRQINWHRTICAAPESLRGENVLNVKFDEMQCSAASSQRTLLSRWLVMFLIYMVFAFDAVVEFFFGVNIILRDE